MAKTKGAGVVVYLSRAEQTIIGLLYKSGLAVDTLVGPEIKSIWDKISKDKPEMDAEQWAFWQAAGEPHWQRTRVGEK